MMNLWGTDRKRGFLGLAFAALAWGLPAKAVTVGESIAGTVIKKHEKGPDLSDTTLKGKITVVNFWATWCAACKVELVEMEDHLKTLFGEKDFQIAFVSLDKEPEKAADWMRSNLKTPDQFLTRLYDDPKFEVADKLTIDSFPMTLVIGRDGKVAHIQRGFKEGEGSTEALAKLTQSLLRTAH